MVVRCKMWMRAARLHGQAQGCFNVFTRGVPAKGCNREMIKDHIFPLRPNGLAARLANDLEDILRRIRDVRAGPEDRFDARIVEKIVVLLRDHTAADHDNIARILVFERLHKLRCKGLVPRRL